MLFTSPLSYGTAHYDNTISNVFKFRDIEFNKAIQLFYARKKERKKFKINEPGDSIECILFVLMKRST